MENTRFNNRRNSFDRSKRSGDQSEEGKKKFAYKGPPILGHAPGPVCKKMQSVWRSMIRWRNTNRYRKDIHIPLSGGGKDDNITTVKQYRGKDGFIHEIIVPSVNQIWRQMMDGPRPKKRLKNVRMPEPKTNGKRR